MVSVGIIGLGLLGGSIARAIKRNKPGTNLIGVEPSSRALEQARASQLFAELTSEVAEPLSTCEVVFVCVPFGAVDAVFQKLGTIVANTALITDVTGLKGPVEELATTRIKQGRFVGSHPMAGGTAGGFEHASESLFDGKPVAVCGSGEGATTIGNWWKSLGAIPIFLAPDEHDQLVALISHLPYLSSLALSDVTSEHPDALALAGPGYKRATLYADFAPSIMGDVVVRNPHLPALARKLASYLESLADKLENRPEEFLEDVSRIHNDHKESLKSS